MDPATGASCTQIAGKRICCVKNCKSRWKCVAIRLCFHRFPVANETIIHRINEFGDTEQIDRLEAWKIALGIDNYSPNFRVCSLHFTKKDYVAYYSTGCKRKCLKRTAVPSVSVPNDFFKIGVLRPKKFSPCVNQEITEPIIPPVSMPNDFFKIQVHHPKKFSPCVNQEITEPIVPSVSVPNDFFNIHRPKKFSPCVNQEITEPSVHVEIKEEIEVKDEPLEEVLVEPPEQTLTDTDINLPIIENNFLLTPQKECLPTKPIDTSKAKTFQHTGVQVDSLNIVPIFMDFISNNSELHTITGIPSFEDLDAILESVIEETQGKYEKVSCHMKTTERIIMTCAKMKHDLSYTFLAIMFKNTYGKITQMYCKNVFTDMITILYRCCQNAPTDDIIHSIFTQKCLNFDKYQMLIHRDLNT